MTNTINKIAFATLITLTIVFFASTIIASDHKKSETSEKKDIIYYSSRSRIIQYFGNCFNRS